ncbi:MAG: threonylcarbamoyl-AMP synthase [Trueperaceae bacterium]|nr:threonylcarbamoyl-AMP synthase [Trueperaceae bacterium]MCC6310104.1 threonylcarbamoyl-AMP synthase [Trueperaceae bacterium]MCO5174165.1 L-threonylcarbamoyladenylate synthase [Trueperaceae bacterium]
MRILPPTPENVGLAAELLAAGRLVAMPTETVYGLAASARDERAVARVFELKGRPRDHPLIVHLGSGADAGGWVEHAREHGAHRRLEALAAALWPGPLTLVVRKAAWVPDVLTGGQPTVALRVPGHPVALALLDALGGAVAAPSANRFGRISPTTAEHVAAEFGAADLVVLDGGACRVGLESTILDLTGPVARVLRPGGVTVEAIEAVVGERVEVNGDAAAPRVPGSLPSHYAPTAPTRLVGPAELERRIGEDAGMAVLARRHAPEAFAGLWVALPDDPVAFGASLYAALRRLDSAAPREILIERVPLTPPWLAVRDRLARASAPRPGVGVRAPAAAAGDVGRRA